MNKKKNPLHPPIEKRAKRGLSQNGPATSTQAPTGIVKRQAEQFGSTPGPVQWKPCLDSYEDLRALQFGTPEHFAAAAKLLWTGELRDLPYDLVGNHTIIVPAEAVPYFRGLKVTETDILRPSDLPAQELSKLRMDQGPY